MHCILPWGLGKTVETNLVEERERQREWKERVDLGVLVLVSYVVLVRVGFGYLSFPTVRYTARSQSMGRGAELKNDPAVYLSYPLVRAGLVYLQLMVIVGLTADGGTSIVSRILR